MSIIPPTPEVKTGKSQIRGQPSKVSKTLSQKQNTNKKGRGVDQMVKNLPSMSEAQV
jgi:hypothetical protein